MPEKLAFFCDSSTSWLILFLLEWDGSIWQEIKQQKVYIPHDRDDWFFQAIREFIDNEKNISLLSLGKGPGSFTGLRVSFAFCRTWALLRDLPIVLINSFDFYERIFLVNEDIPLLIRANRFLFFGRKKPSREIESKTLFDWQKEINCAKVFADAWRGNSQFPINWGKSKHFQEETLNEKKIPPPPLPSFTTILENREIYHWEKALPFYGLPLQFKENPRRLL